MSKPVIVYELPSGERDLLADLEAVALPVEAVLADDLADRAAPGRTGGGAKSNVPSTASSALPPPWTAVMPPWCASSPRRPVIGLKSPPGWSVLWMVSVSLPAPSMMLTISIVDSVPSVVKLCVIGSMLIEP